MGNMWNVIDGGHGTLGLQPTWALSISHVHMSGSVQLWPVMRSAKFNILIRAGMTVICRRLGVPYTARLYRAAANVIDT